MPPRPPISTSSEQQAVIAAFLDRYLTDRARGHAFGVEEYQKAFPDWDDLIRAEYEALTGWGAGVPGISDAEAPMTSPFEMAFEQDVADQCVQDLSSYLRRFPDEPDAIADAFARMAWPEELPRDGSTPEHIAHFAIERVLGQGAQASVYLAQDNRSGRTSALKVFTAPVWDKVAYARFQVEAKAARRVRHTNVPAFHDAGYAGTLGYMAQEYIEGVRLDAWIAGENGAAIPYLDGWEEIVRSFLSVAGAVHAAHNEGVIHRDVKPSNLLAASNGRVVLHDFGVAALRDWTPEKLEALARTAGTPRYMAPELLRNTSDRAEPQADVFSLGATLYECLSGKPPFGSGTREELAGRIESTLPDAVEGVPDPLNDALRAALHPDRAERTATADRFARDLSRVLASTRD